MRTYCIAPGTRLSALWWPKWEGNPKGRGYMYLHSWFSLLYNRNKNQIIKCNNLRNCSHLSLSKQQTSESRQVMFDSFWLHGLCSPWNSPGQNTGVGSLSLLHGIFPTQGSNPGLPHCGWIVYQLSHQGSPTTNKKGHKLLLQCKQLNEKKHFFY